MKNILFIFSLIGLSGCALFTNSIHDYRMKSRFIELWETAEIHRIENVYYDKQTSDIIFCFEGSFHNGEKGIYELALPGIPLPYTPKRNKYTGNDTIIITVSEITKGCNVSRYHALIRLKEQSSRFGEPTGPMLPENTNMNYVSYYAKGDYTEESPLKGNIEYKYYVGIEVNNFTNLDFTHVNIKTRINDEGKKLSRKSHYVIESDHSSYELEKYEYVGNVIDIMTAIFQVPICISSFGKICSNKPHPRTGGFALVPG